MSCKPTYKGIRYNSLEELYKANGIVEQERQQAQSLKDAEKLFGVKLNPITDSKGNLWYEFDIPKKFKEGKGEIKAFSTIPVGVGTAGAIGSTTNNKNSSNEQ